MYQPSTNFWGKDPMKWWIGQVTDPDKGKWGDSLEKTRAANGEDLYGFRCRVRIVGYHDCADDLPDEDLPLAHILLPSNTATTGGCGKTVQYQGGEVVVGFFMDGDDAQQPVIFGTLYKQPFVPDQLTTAQFNAKKQTCFVPYTPPKVRQTAGKTHITKNSPVSIAMSDGESTKTLAQDQVTANENITTDTFSPCEDNEISKISNTIKDFTRKMETLQQLNEASTYVDPIYGGIIDIKSEVKLATNKIHKSMTKLVRRGRSWLIQDTLDKLDTTLENKVDKFNQVVMGQATNALTSVIFCNIEKIQDGLLDYLSKSLENMIGQVLDVPTCGVQNFMGDMFGQINNLIDSSLGGMFDQLNNIQGGGIALPSATFTKAIKFANIITNVLDCDKVNCPETTSFSSKGGVTKSVEDSFDDIIDKLGLDRLTNIADGIDDIADGIPALPSAPDCNTNVLKCGPPRVDFIGGGGTGATGSAIINAVGKIIGVAIGGPGSGFKEPPLLSFFDSCDRGSGAGGYARMKDGKVADVVITNPGEGYLPNTTETTRNPDGTLTETIVTPDPNGNYDGEVTYVTSLDDVVVENTGFGYDDNDTVTVDGGSIDGDTIQGPGQAEVELNIQNGLIVGVNVVNGGFGFTDLPDLLINSDTGAGARLKPVLKFTKVDDAAQLAQTTQDAVVTVISCIEK